MFPIRCATVVELWIQQMGDFYEKPHFTLENFKFREAVKWEWNVFHQTTKRHTLTPNLVEQIVWRMWQWRCFDTIRRREKKAYARMAIGKSTRLWHYVATAITYLHNDVTVTVLAVCAKNSHPLSGAIAYSNRLDRTTVYTSVSNLVKIDKEMRPWEWAHTDGQTDANRFYYLSHAICYSR